jgi:hypothetical protein
LGSKLEPVLVLPQNLETDLEANPFTAAPIWRLAVISRKSNSQIHVLPLDDHSIDELIIG